MLYIRQGSLIEQLMEWRSVHTIAYQHTGVCILFCWLQKSVYSAIQSHHHSHSPPDHPPLPHRLPSFFVLILIMGPSVFFSYAYLSLSLSASPLHPSRSVKDKRSLYIFSYPPFYPYISSNITLWVLWLHHQGNVTRICDSILLSSLWVAHMLSCVYLKLLILFFLSLVRMKTDWWLIGGRRHWPVNWNSRWKEK